MPNNDRKLVKGLRKGKEKAMHQLFSKYHSALYYHALDFVKDPQQAEDIVQEVFIKVWEKRAQLKPDLSFKAYLYCITKNLVINQLRRSGREIKAKAEISYQSMSFHNQAEDHVIYNDYETIAYQAMEKLPPKRKMVYAMHRLEGRKYDEIAAHMNISKNTVRDHVVKAEKSIKEYFACQADIIISLLMFIIPLIG